MQIDPLAAIAHRGLVKALTAGAEYLKHEGAEALAYNLDEARCRRKFAAAERVIKFRKAVTQFIGTPFFPFAEADTLALVARLSGVAMDGGLYSDEERATLTHLVEAGYLKYVSEKFSETRTVSFWTLDFEYADRDRTNS